MELYVTDKICIALEPFQIRSPPIQVANSTHNLVPRFDGIGMGWDFEFFVYFWEENFEYFFCTQKDLK